MYARTYVWLIIFAAIVGFFYSVRSDGVFACQAPSDPSTHFTGICNAEKFGDYDHGAFWLNLEPEAVRSARNADVLFLGNSRMQFGFSSGEVHDWFDRRPNDFYLLGFSHSENVQFVGPLLQKLKPSAKMYVVNVDAFFDDRLTGPADTLMNSSDAENRYVQKTRWLAIHRWICTRFRQVCGNTSSYIRARTTGEWIFKGADLLARSDFSDRPIPIDSSIDERLIDSIEPRARDFLRDIEARRECIVLTNTPNFDTSHGTALLLSERLGLALVAPKLDGLLTFDGSHLNEESASLWSKAFLSELQTHVDRCMASGGPQ